MVCKDCLYYEVCPLGLAVDGQTGTCLKFKNSADFVEVVRCKDCRFKLLTVDGYYNPSNISCEIHENDGYKETDYCNYGKRRNDNVK